jgi:hypothetical protein
MLMNWGAPFSQRRCLLGESRRASVSADRIVKRFAISPFGVADSTSRLDGSKVANSLAFAWESSWLHTTRLVRQLMDLSTVR